MEEGNKPHIGQIVKVRRGRDLGKYAVIVNIIDQRFVMIVDGDKRKFDQPKRKNLIHLVLQDEISSEVVNSLRENGRVTNGKIRFAISKFAESKQTDAQEKGE